MSGPQPSAADTEHLIIPFAARATPACLEALPRLRLANLEALLARLVPVSEDLQPEDTRSPPHERALAAALGLPLDDGRLPWAALAAREAGLDAEDGGEDDSGEHDGSWAFATLCHWQVGMDSVVLGDPDAVGVDAAESDALLAVARPYFAEDGIALHAGPRPGRWLARGRAFDGLATAALDRAAGRPIADWLPLYDDARALRRLQNEMQMLLYTERVNDERVARGQVPINSFWLSGTGTLPAGWQPPATAPQVADGLRPAALRDDGEAWRQAWEALDEGPVAQLLAAQEAGRGIRLALCGDRGVRLFARRPRGLVRWARELFRRDSVATVLRTL